MSGGKEKERLGVAAEMMAEQVEGTGGVTESAGNLRDGLVLDEISAEGFILALLWLIRFKKESADVTYVFRCSYRHSCNFPHRHLCVNGEILTSARQMAL